MSSKGLDPSLHRPASSGRSPWLGRALVGLRAFVAVAAAGVLAFVAFNSAIMPHLVRQGREVQVPDVTGRSLTEAASHLAASGLAVRDTVERNHPTIAAGLVMDQDPAPGRRVKPERRVQLVLSRGGRERKVPSLVGQTLRFARLSLGQEGYVLGDVVRVASSRTPKDFVVACDPPEGTVLNPGQRVSVLVSTGGPTPLLVLPDLRGQPLSRVEEELRYAGFDVSTRTRSESPFSWRLEVVDSVPPPGSRIRPGEPVLLIGG